MNVNEQIRIKVMQLREQKGFSQTSLANAIGISRSHMNKLENGTLQMSLVYLKQIADALGVSIDLFFEEDTHAKEVQGVFDFVGVNQGIQELANEYIAMGEQYFTVNASDLYVTKEKLASWKQDAQAGSIIVGSVACRYLIISNAKPDPKKPGFLRTSYGFLNIDHAGWELCSPRFDSTDELVEWFAGNIENPIIEIIPASTTEQHLPGQMYL